MLFIQVHEARNLAARDVSIFGRNSSDPYVILEYNDEEVYRTGVIKRTLHPVWTGASAEIAIREIAKDTLRFVWCVCVSVCVSVYIT